MNQTLMIHDVKGIKVTPPKEGQTEDCHYFVREITIIGEMGDNIVLNLFSDSMKGLLIRSEEE